VFRHRLVCPPAETRPARAAPQAELSLAAVDLAGAARPAPRWLRLLANRHGHPVGKDLGRIQARPRRPPGLRHARAIRQGVCGRRTGRARHPPSHASGGVRCGDHTLLGRSDVAVEG
jgi:hypothetical protein